ncbi:MAG: ankyrin repeat protein [Chthonomonadaceae bacterium]|nr:ankyrin repeat protein [Chthonomonadaceae bacterium]
MNKRRRYRAVLFLGTVCLLMVGAGGLRLRSQQRQEALNRQLIASLVKQDDHLALSLINAGADPNTHLEPLPAPSIQQLWDYVLHRSPLPVNDSLPALLIACGVYWTDDRGYIYGGHLHSTPLVAAMLRHGANVEVKDDQGWTPLTYAAYQKDRKMVDVLLAHGANANAEGLYGGSPLYWAMSFPWGVDDVLSDDSETPGILLALLAHGAAPNLPDKGGTLLQHAAKRPDLVAILRKAGAKK